MGTISFSGSIKINIDGANLNTLDLGATSDSVGTALSQAFADGAGENQANKFFHDRVDIPPSGSKVVYINGTSQETDGLGQLLAITKLKALIIKSNATLDKLTLGNSTNPVPLFSSGATHTFDIHPGGIFLVTWPTAAGLACVANSSDEIKLAHEGVGSVTVTADVYVYGA